MQPETAPAGTAPAAYTFPFPVPADLTAATDADLRALHQQVRDHAASFSGLAPNETTDDTLTALRACRDLAVAIAAELNSRTAAAEQATGREGEAAALAAEIGGPAAELPAVTAAGAGVPSVRQIAQGQGQPNLGPNDQPRAGSMTAAAELAGFSNGQRLTRFEDAARVLSAQLDRYPAMTQGRTEMSRGPDGQIRRPVTTYDPEGRELVMSSFTRHPGVQIHREFPDDLRIPDGASEQRGYAIAEYAATERRLPGGSLLSSYRTQFGSDASKRRSLTAATGWCAPSDVILDLCELETTDGILDAPQVETTRGGWQIPSNGGPDFATIYGLLGNAGNTHLSESQVASGTAKVCTEIPCPPFTDVRLGVDYYCLTGGLLQRRGYPEVVARWGRAGVVALAHKINAGFITAIQTASGATNVIGSDPSGDDAASATLAGVELAITDMKYRNRMGFNATLEVVLPWWILQPIRAGLSRRRGIDVDQLGITDAMIVDWFTVRGAVPRFVYDWQDASSGLAGGPGGTSPLTTLPTHADFLIYPAGTWVKAVQDVVSLDTIYDASLLATNQFTAVFVEDGWAALQMCPLSRRYTVMVDPSGVVGCCPTTLS